MVKIIKLTRDLQSGNKALYLNVAHIVSFLPIPVGTKIFTSEMKDEEHWIVTESAEEVAAKCAA